jgi:hypothetical protein
MYGFRHGKFEMTHGLELSGRTAFRLTQGDYFLTYTCTAESGEPAIPVTRTIKVRQNYTDCASNYKTMDPVSNSFSRSIDCTMYLEGQSEGSTPKLPMEWAEAFAQYAKDMNKFARRLLVPNWRTMGTKAHELYIVRSQSSLKTEKQNLREAQHRAKKFLTKRLKKELAKRTAAKMPLVSKKRDLKYYEWFLGKIDTSLGKAIIGKQHLQKGSDGIWRATAISTSKAPTTAPTISTNAQTGTLLSMLMSDLALPTPAPTPAIKSKDLLAKMQKLMMKMSDYSARSLEKQKREEKEEADLLLPPTPFPTPRPTHMSDNGDRQHHHHHNLHDDDDDDDDDNFDAKAQTSPPQSNGAVDAVPHVIDVATMQQMLQEAKEEGVGTP